MMGGAAAGVEVVSEVVTGGGGATGAGGGGGGGTARVGAAAAGTGTAAAEEETHSKSNVRPAKSCSQVDAAPRDETLSPASSSSPMGNWANCCTVPAASCSYSTGSPAAVAAPGRGAGTRREWR